MTDLLQRAGEGNAAAALRGLGAATLREAQTQSFGDIYVVIMVCFIITAALVPLMRKIAPAKTPVSEAH